MHLDEYRKVKGLTYWQYCDYLKGKYGCLKECYGSKSNSRSSDGLFIHHIGENEVANLSNDAVRKGLEKEKDQKYQSPEMLCYCDWLEHLLLHIMIGEETAGTTNLGLEGCFTYLLPALRDFFEYGKKTCNYNAAYYDVISGDKDVFEDLLARYNETVKSRIVVQEHNKVLYEQVEFNLEKNNKALVVLGTGLGKTLTAMNYLYKHTCRGLVICPNKLTMAGWEKYGDFVDVTTYQSFALDYDKPDKYDYSKYGLVIIDEAHHSGYDSESDKGAAVWSQGIDYVVSHGVKLLGLTATPVRSDGIDVGETVFGGCVCEGRSIEDAIEEGIVHPFSYVTALYNTSEAVEQAKKYKHDLEGDSSDLCRKLIGQLDIAIQRAPTIGDILRKYMPSGKRKGIIFIQNIEDKGAVEAIFRSVYPDAEYRAIDSKMPEKEVSDNREWFEKADEGYLLAINMISEGAHYKGVNTLIMFRTTASYLVYAQQLGRIVTLAKNEDPHAIVFDLVNNVNNVSCDDREFKKEKKDRNPAQDIIRALKAVKSDQIIIADEARDIVECLKEIKSYSAENAPWEAWEDDILREYYKTEKINGCYKRINDEWAKRFGVDAIEKRTKKALGSRVNDSLKLFYLSPWTESEDNILKEHYPSEGAKGCLKYLPNRTVPTIKNRVRKLHIDNFVKRFSEEDDNFLQENFQKMNIKDLAISLNASVGGVRGRLKKLKLKKQTRAEWSEEELQIVKDNYDHGVNYILTLLPNRTKAMVKNAVKSMGLHNGKLKFWTKEELETIKKYYFEEGKNGVSKRLGKSPMACEQKAAQLNLRYKGNGLDPWSQKADDVVRKYYPIEGSDGVYKRLTSLGMSMTKSRIRDRATKVLGVKSPQVWTQEELDILKKFYPTEGVDGILKRLKKSKSQISNKAFKLKLKYVGVHNREWTKEEDDIIIKNYSLGGVDRCADLLDRSREAIVSRAKFLNVKVLTQARYNQKPFKNIETGEIFESTKDLKEKYPEIHVGNVQACLNGKQKTSSGYHWVYLDDDH